MVWDFDNVIPRVVPEPEKGSDDEDNHKDESDEVGDGNSESLNILRTNIQCLNITIMKTHMPRSSYFPSIFQIFTLLLTTAMPPFATHLSQQPKPSHTPTHHPTDDSSVIIR